MARNEDQQAISGVACPSSSAKNNHETWSDGQNESPILGSMPA